MKNSRGADSVREAIIDRTTKETNIHIELSLDNHRKVCSIKTGIGFFDHMLTALSLHSGIALNIQCDGDLDVDSHHTIEDVGIVLGQAFDKALNDKTSIERYGHAYIPMDEALGFASIDISGRPYLVFDATFSTEMMGKMETQMVEEFFRAFAMNAKVTLHVRSLYGKNDHHQTEAMFKAVAHALKHAVKVRDDAMILSTKGVI